MLINGQSGRVEGDYPKSPAKLAAIGAAILLIVLLVWFLSGAKARGGYIEPGSAWVQEAVTEACAAQTEGSREAENEEEIPWVYSVDSLRL